MGGNWYGFVKLRSRVSDKQLLPPACWLQWLDYDIKEEETLLLWYTCLRHGGKKTRTAWRTEAIAPLTIIPLSLLQSSISQNVHRFFPCLHFSKTDLTLVHLKFLSPRLWYFFNKYLRFFERFLSHFPNTSFHISQRPLQTSNLNLQLLSYCAVQFCLRTQSFFCTFLQFPF